MRHWPRYVPSENKDTLNIITDTKFEKGKSVSNQKKKLKKGAGKGKKKWVKRANPMVAEITVTESGGMDQSKRISPIPYSSRNQYDQQYLRPDEAERGYFST